MGSSAKTGNIFFKDHRNTFCIKMPFGIGHPHLHIKCSLYVCSRVQGSQIFKWNSIISIHSKIIAYLLFQAPWPLGREQVEAGGLGVSRDMGGVPIHMHTCMHAHMHAHADVKNLQMAATCLSCCPHVVPVVPTSSRRSPHHLQPPQIAATPKFNKIWTNQDISIPFEDLKSVKTPPPMGGCMGWWVGGWIGGLMGEARSNH